MLIESFLANRKQQTVLSGKSSKWGSITAGVPQDSILGRLFFLVYINDLTDGLKCSEKVFADDMSIFTVHDPNIAAENRNHDLHLISLWAYKRRMSYNPDPTKQAVEITFSKKIPPANYPPIFFNSVSVRKVPEQNHLGIILDSKLSVTPHIKVANSRSR